MYLLLSNQYPDCTPSNILSIPLKIICIASYILLGFGTYEILLLHRKLGLLPFLGGSTHEIWDGGGELGYCWA